MMRAVIAVVVILVLLGGIVLVAGGNSTITPRTTSSTSPAVTAQPMNAQPAVLDETIVRPKKIVLDCSKPDYIEDTFVDKDGVTTKVLEIGKVTEGEEIQFLRSPKWINKCIPDEKEKEKLADAGKLPGLAIYNFNVERDDTYYVFLSAKWTDTCGNSVFVLMNGPEKGGHGPDGNDYKSIKDQAGFVSAKEYRLAWHGLTQDNQPFGFKLKKGPNRIELHTRQDGPRFDQLVITTEANAPAVTRVTAK